MTKQGGKTIVKKQPVTGSTGLKKTSAKKPTSSSVPKPEARPRKEIERTSKLESLAMIQHVHGGKIRRPKKSFFGLKRMKQVVEADWSLWHLSWSVLWRVVLIALVIRFLALLTVAYFSNLILTQ